MPGSARHRLALAAACVAAFLALRVPLLTRQGLWADEFFSLAMATGHSLEHPAVAAKPAEGDFVEASGTMPASHYASFLSHDAAPAGPGRVVRAVALSDTSPPLYYLLLGGWTRAFGTSDAALRSLSLLFALMTLPLVALLARRIAGPHGVVAACLLYTLLPASIWYSTEGRMYSLLWCEAAALAALSVELARNSGSSGGVTWRLGLGWTLVAGVGLLTHYAFAFVVAAVCVALLWKPGRLPRGRLVLLALLAAALAAPWYRTIPAANAAWRVTKGWLELRPRGFTWPRGVAQLGWSLVSDRGAWGGVRGEDLLQAGVLLAVVAAGTWRLRARWLAGRRPVAWLWLLAAIAGPVVLDVLQGTYMTAVPRYALAGLPAAIVLLACAIAALPARLRIAALAIMAVSCGLGARRTFEPTARAGQPYRELATTIAAFSKPGDVLVVHSIPSGVAGLSRALVAAGAASLPVLSWVTQLGTRRAPDDVVAAAIAGGRVLHVTIHAVGAEPAAARWLEEHAKRGVTLAAGGTSIDVFRGVAPPRR